MIWDRKQVRFWEERVLSWCFRSRPWTAATTLPAATMDGGTAMNFTSGGERKGGGDGCGEWQDHGGLR